MDIVADAKSLQHHFSGAFEDDTAPDVRSVEMPGHRNFCAFDADLSQGRYGLPHLGIDSGIAFGMPKCFAQDADTQSLRRLAEPSHVVAGSSCNRSGVPSVMARD